MYVHKFSMQDQHSGPLINQLLTMAMHTNVSRKVQFHSRYTVSTHCPQKYIRRWECSLIHSPCAVPLQGPPYMCDWSCASPSSSVHPQTVAAGIGRTVTVNELCTVGCGRTCIIQIQQKWAAAAQLRMNIHTYNLYTLLYVQTYYARTYIHYHTYTYIHIHIFAPCNYPQNTRSMKLKRIPSSWQVSHWASSAGLAPPVRM